MLLLFGSFQISRQKQRVGLMDQSLVVCLITSGALFVFSNWQYFSIQQTSIFTKPFLNSQNQDSLDPSSFSVTLFSSSLHIVFVYFFKLYLCLCNFQIFHNLVHLSIFFKSGLLGPLVILCNTLLFLSPHDPDQRTILCGLLILVNEKESKVANSIWECVKSSKLHMRKCQK